MNNLYRLIIGLVADIIKFHIGYLLDIYGIQLASLYLLLLILVTVLGTIGVTGLGSDSERLSFFDLAFRKSLVYSSLIIVE